MGVGFLVLLVALVPFASSRDLRTASNVNRRTAPDPLLVQLFNDPTATSQLTKQLLDKSDDDSASGSGLWAASGDGPTSDVKTTATETAAPTATVTKPEPVTLANDAPVWDNSGSGSGSEDVPKTNDVTVETKDDSVKNVDENAKKSSFVPSQTQTVTDQVVEGNDVHDSAAAPKADAKDMYDATIVKKDDVPKPDDLAATPKSVIVETPAGGLQPLTSDPVAQPQDLSQMAMQPQQDMTQAAYPQPPQMQQDMSQAASQPQQDMSQAASQPQQDISQAALQPQQDMAQYAMQPQQDMAQAQTPAPQQDAAASQQMMAPNMMNSTMYQGAPLQSGAQDYGQYQDQSQAAAYPQSNQAVDQDSMQGQAAVNPYAGDQYSQQQIDPQTGLPYSGLQQVPVFKGLKAKKVDIKEDECEDMYDSCPDMAKNKYCTNFAELMHVQCKKSCGFCKVKDESSASGSGSAVWDGPEEGDKVVGESSGSGSAAATDVWSSSASGENMLKGEAEAGAVTDVVNDEEPEAPAKKEEKEDSTVETETESGSGEPSDDLESSGANLAEDLATGTVSRSEQEIKETTAPKAKYSEIPAVPRVVVQQQPAAEVYPHIDLKVIAKAVQAYKSTALRMLGEAIRDSAQEAENEATKRTNIPMPPANELLKKMGFPMDQPQYGYPYAQYYQSPYAEAAAAARAKIAKAKADAEKKAKEEAEAAAKAKAKAEEEARKQKERDREGSADDPYEYVRNMPKGASMQPIESHPGASVVAHGHSNPIILFKNSQISNAEAAKKATIPRPQPAVSKFLMQQMPQAAAPRSGVMTNDLNSMGESQSNDFIQDSSMEMPANSTEQFTNPIPEGDNQMMNNLAGDSQAPFVQQQGSQDAELRSYFPGKKKKRSVKTTTSH